MAQNSPMLTYEQQLALVKQKFAKVSVNNNLSTFKYSPKVHFNKLWDSIPGMLECRGHTYDNTTGELVLAAPTKTFNYDENNTWRSVPLDSTVTLYKKFNGFMATVSIHNEELVVGTTGSTKSDFAILAKNVLVTQFGSQESLIKFIKSFNQKVTLLYEICDISDPHIVHENPGAYLLGVRYHQKGYKFSPVSNEFTIVTDLKTALSMVKVVTGIEGWMAYLDNHSVCKLKTDYYVYKKRLMRMSEQNIIKMFNDVTTFNCPQLFNSVVSSIVQTFSPAEWVIMPEQDRRVFIESIPL